MMSKVGGMLEVRDLHKFYGSFHAVRGVTFDVDAGEIVGFLGPNGAGKTTTMKIVTGYMAMSAGAVKVGGFDVVNQSINVRRRIGYLPEDAPLYDDMRVREYLAFMCEMRGIRGRERKERIEYAIGVCALQPKRRALIKTLSKGYRQRVGLAQAIIHRPQLVILDEPTVGLDPNQIVEIRELLREIGRENTVILSSHILAEIEAMASRVMIINDGQVVANDTPSRLIDGGVSAGRYHVSLAGSATDANADLTGIEGVFRTETLTPADGRGRFVCEVDDAAAFPERLTAVARSNDWSVTELRRELPSLEDVFRRVTARPGTGEHETVPAAAVGADENESESEVQAEVEVVGGNDVGGEER